MTVEPSMILFLLLAGHALADYPLQGDWLSKAKNPTLDLVPGEEIWQGAMTCHCLIHALSVWIITQSPMLMAFEFFLHFWIDYSKCKGRIGYAVDQGLHVVCKFLWAFLFLGGFA